MLVLLTLSQNLRYAGLACVRQAEGPNPSDPYDTHMLDSQPDLQKTTGLYLIRSQSAMGISFLAAYRMKNMYILENSDFC